MIRSRNNAVDVIRGFAMLLVVLGHTLSGSTVKYQESLIYQIIWTLQMPLFVIISGYVTRYSKPLKTKNDLLIFLKKRTIAYLLPWCIWTFIVRAVLFRQTNFFDIKWLLWHMDAGYWFLITIWTISVVYGITDYFSLKISFLKYNRILHIIFCGIGMIGLAFIGKILGLGFFSIKLTLYYFPFYLLGYLYGQSQNLLFQNKKLKLVLEGIVSVFFAIWLYFINRYDFFEGNDNSLFIIFRFLISVIGCISVISLFATIQESSKLSKFFNWAGIHSLEIYLTHYLFLNLIKTEEIPALMTLDGICMLLVNYIITIVCTITIIMLVKGNNVMNYLLYAKRDKK